MARSITYWLLLACALGLSGGISLAWGQEVIATMPLRELRAAKGGYPTSLTFSRDGKLIACGAGSVISVWNVEDGKVLTRIQLPRKQYDHQLAFAPDSKTLILSGRDDAMTRIFDVTNGKQVHEFNQPRPGGHFLAYSADGQRVAFCGEQFFKGVDVFEAATGKRVLHLDEPENCRGCDFSTDGKLIATISGTHRGLSIWDAATGKVVKHISEGDKNLPGAFAFVKFSPDGNFPATGGHNAISKVWSVRTGKVLCTLDADFSIMTFAPDNLSVLRGSALFNLITEKVVCNFNAPVRRASFSRFSPDFKRVAVIAPSSVDGVESSAEDGQGSIYLFDVPAKALDPVSARFDDGPLDNLWNDLSSENELRLQVVLKAFRAAPKQTVALVGKKLQPISREMQQKLEKHVANLDDDSFLKRDEAMSEVQGFAHQFSPLLKKKLSQSSAGEVRNRLTFVLDQMSAEKLPSAMVIQLRAMALLEDLATREARDLLDQLAAGADGARLTTEAQAALDRLKAKAPPPR